MWSDPGSVTPARVLPAHVKDRLDSGAPTCITANRGFGIPSLIERWLRDREESHRAIWCDATSVRGSDLRWDAMRASIAEVVSEQKSGSSRVTIVVQGAEHLTAQRQEFLMESAKPEQGVRVILLAHRPFAPKSSESLSHREARYTREDCAAAFAEADIAVSETALDQVMVHTDGWPGLVDAVVSACVSGGSYDHLDLELGLVRAELRGHLGTWIPEHWQSAARYFAVVERISAEEVNALDDPSVATAVREMLELGVIRRDEQWGDSCLAILPLLQQALHDDLQARDYQDLLRCLGDVARLRHRLGVLDCGLNAAIEAKDWSLCSAIIDTHASRLTFTPHYRDVQSALYSMPLENVRERVFTSLRAELIGVLPVGATVVALPHSDADIRRVVRTGEARRHLERSFAAMSARRARGRLFEARDIAHATGPLVEFVSASPRSSAGGFLAFWSLHAGFSCWLAGHEGEAKQFFSRGWQMRRYDDTQVAASDLASKLSLLAAFQGHTGEARGWLEEQQHVPELWYPWDVWFHSSFWTSELILATDGLDLDRAADMSARLDREYLPMEVWALILWSQARHDLLRGQPHRALERIESSRSGRADVMQPGTLNHSLCTVLTAEARLALGQATLAGSLLSGLPDSLTMAAPARARLNLVAGLVDEALALAVDAAGRQDASQRVRRELEVLEAAALLRSGKIAAATSRLEVLLARNATHELGYAFAALPLGILDEMALHVPALVEVATNADKCGIMSLFPASVSMITLTPRERIVLRALADGGRQEDIAQSLHVSLNTVKSQVREVYSKLGVHNRAEAIAAGRRLGLMDTEG